MRTPGIMGMIATIILALSLLGASYNTQPGKRIPLPAGRDIRKITSPSDITAQDITKLNPQSPVMTYYYEHFQTPKKVGDTNYLQIELYFVSLLSVDYLGMNNFAADVFGPTGGLRPADKMSESMPNFVAYMRHLSLGDINRKIENFGKFQKVTLDMVLSEKELHEHFPNIMGKFNGAVANFWLELKDARQNTVVRFDYAENKGRTVYFLDSNGFFVPMGKDGKPVAGASVINEADAGRGFNIILDFGFTTKANMLKLMKVLTLEVKKVRTQLTMRFNPDHLSVSWKITDIVPGTIQLAGINPDILQNSILNLKGTLSGTLEFQPMQVSGRKMTFMRLYNTSEEIDHWLVHLALTTWENMGSQTMKDLSIPLAEAMIAVKRDILMKTSSGT